jgi:hypothetical protein
MNIGHNWRDIKEERAPGESVQSFREDYDREKGRRISPEITIRSHGVTGIPDHEETFVLPLAPGPGETLLLASTKWYETGVTGDPSQGLFRK